MLEKNVFEFPSVWKLSTSYRPDLLYGLFKHIFASEKRYQHATQSLQWFPVGFHSLHLAMRFSPKGEMTESLQMNLYHPQFPSNEHEHAHARDARSFWYAGPKTHQHIYRSKLLPKHAWPMRGVSVQERELFVNCITHLDGRKPAYHPVALGKRLVIEQSSSSVPDQGHQTFSSTEIHNVGFEGDGMGISLHYKGPEESKSLNSRDGMVHYKGLTIDEIFQLEDKTPKGHCVRTLILPPVGFSVEEFETKPSSPSSVVGTMLLEEALRMVQRLTT